MLIRENLMLVIVLAAIAALSGCGMDHRLSGDIKVIHEINLDSLRETFRDYCEIEHVAIEDVESCMNENLTLLIQLITNTKGDT